MENYNSNQRILSSPNYTTNLFLLLYVPFEEACTYFEIHFLFLPPHLSCFSLSSFFCGSSRMGKNSNIKFKPSKKNYFLWLVELVYDEDCYETIIGLVRVLWCFNKNETDGTLLSLDVKKFPFEIIPEKEENKHTSNGPFLYITHIYYIWCFHRKIKKLPKNCFSLHKLRKFKSSICFFFLITHTKHAPFFQKSKRKIHKWNRSLSTGLLLMRLSLAIGRVTGDTHTYKKRSIKKNLLIEKGSL